MSPGELSFNNIFLIITSLYGLWQILMKRNNRWNQYQEGCLDMSDLFGFQWYCAGRMNDAFIRQLQFHSVYKLLFLFPITCQHILDKIWKISICDTYLTLSKQLYTISVVVPHSPLKTDKASLNCVCLIRKFIMPTCARKGDNKATTSTMSKSCVHNWEITRRCSSKMMMMLGINNPHVSAAGWKMFQYMATENL